MNNPDDPRLPCAGLHDLASVSMTVRSFSKSLRRAPPPISINVRLKLPLIARRGVHHCASLQLNHVQFENRSSSWVEVDRNDRRLPKGSDYGSQTGRGLAGLASEVPGIPLHSWTVDRPAMMPSIDRPQCRED